MVAPNERDIRMKDFQTKFVKGFTTEGWARSVVECFTKRVEDVESGNLRFDASVSFGCDRHGEITDTAIDDWKVYDEEGNEVDWLTLEWADLLDMFYATVEAAEDYLPSESELSVEYQSAEDEYYANMYDGSEDRFYDED